MNSAVDYGDIPSNIAALTLMLSVNRPLPVPVGSPHSVVRPRVLLLTVQTVLPANNIAPPLRYPVQWRIFHKKVEYIFVSLGTNKASKQ